MVLIKDEDSDSDDAGEEGERRRRVCSHRDVRCLPTERRPLTMELMFDADWLLKFLLNDQILVINLRPVAFVDSAKDYRL